MKKTFLPISSYRITRLAVVACVCVLGAYGTTATAQTLTTLYDFCSQGCLDGENPDAGLVQGSDGNFYGTTYEGGANDGGTVFKITPQGTLTTLWQFGPYPSTNGLLPEAGLVQGSDSNFYGTTYEGGANDDGTVFKITPQGTLTTLWQFSGTNGIYPMAGLVQGSDGNFYGTTYGGGPTNFYYPNGYGTVFKITSQGTLTTLWQFGNNPTKGTFPLAGLVQGSDGNFYGTAYEGGLTNLNYGSGYGTVFKITSQGTLTTLWQFSANPTNGEYPAAGLVQGSDGNFYGTTTRGGTNDGGTVFKITSQGTLTTVCQFATNNTSNGYWPSAGLVQGSDGNFYGTTPWGGLTNLVSGYPGYGTVFKITSQGTLTTLHPFGANPTDGKGPAAGLVQGSDGNLYGTTSEGGTNNAGTVFRLTAIQNAWINTASGKWETGPDWSLARGPSIGDAADLITNAATKTVAIDATTVLSNSINGCLTINSLAVWAPLGSTNTLSLTNAGVATPLQVLGGLAVGNGGVLQVSASSVAVGALTNNMGILTFNSGLLVSGGTYVTNSQTFAVGDAVDAATFQLNGGVHSFANGLEIRNNASLTGCGTVTGNVVVDAGGTVLANCGGNLNITGTVTNDGAISAVSGTTLNFFGPLVNNGAIVATNGAVNFYSTLQNNGTVTGVTNSWTDGTGKWETAANWWLNAATSTSDAADLITNAGNNTVTIDATTVLSNAVNSCLTINNLTVSAPSGTTNTLFLNNAGTVTPLQVFSVLTLGTNGAMVVNNSAAQSTNVVNISSASSSLTVTNGGSLVVTNASRTGSVVVNAGSLILGTGTFEANNLIVTNGGTVQNIQTNQVNNGSVTVAGGSLVATNAPTTIGSVSNSVASLSVSSNAAVLTSLTTLAAGADSTASLTLQGTATMQVLSNLTAGSGVGSTATVSIVGGQLTATNGVIGIGNNGSTTNGFGYAQMTVSNGSVVANQILLGSSAGGHGDLTIQPNGLVSLVGSNALLVPDGVTISGGELDIDNGEIQCGGGASFPGSLTMSSGTANCMVIDVGDTSAGTLTISGGQMSVSPLMDVGYASGSAGAVWMSGGTLTASVIILGDSGVGQLSLSNNGIIQVSSSFSVGASGAQGSAGTLTVAGGALTVNAPLNVGVGSVWVSGGQLQATSLLIGYNNYGVGQLTISNGSVQANSLILTNGADSQIALVGGTLESGGTVVTNNQGFVVGNGSSAATFSMAGGTHWFGNWLEIANNATLSGCGTVNGIVTVDAGGTVVANCGTLTFDNILYNNGLLLADGNSTLEAYSTVVNNGIIDAINGSTDFHAGLNNQGTVLTAANVAISQVSPSGQNFIVKIPSLTGHTYQLQYTASMVSPNWQNTGTSQPGNGSVLTFTDYGATANPQRFYRFLVTAP